MHGRDAFEFSFDRLNPVQTAMESLQPTTATITTRFAYSYERSPLEQPPATLRSLFSVTAGPMIAPTSLRNFNFLDISS